MVDEWGVPVGLLTMDDLLEVIGELSATVVNLMVAHEVAAEVRMHP